MSDAEGCQALRCAQWPHAFVLVCWTETHASSSLLTLMGSWQAGPSCAFESCCEQPPRPLPCSAPRPPSALDLKQGSGKSPVGSWHSAREARGRGSLAVPGSGLRGERLRPAQAVTHTCLFPGSSIRCWCSSRPARRSRTSPQRPSRSPSACSCGGSLAATSSWRLWVGPCTWPPRPLLSP